MTEKGICPCCGEWTQLVENPYGYPIDRRCSDCHEHER